MTIEMILEYVWLILGVSYHYLGLLLPYLLVYTAITFFGLPGFFLGRWYEGHQWRLEIKSGKRLGELVQEQLKKRDDRIGKLTKEIAELESKIEQVGIKHKRMIGLSQEIINVAVSEDVETLKRRRRA